MQHLIKYNRKLWKILRLKVTFVLDTTYILWNYAGTNRCIIFSTSVARNNRRIINLESQSHLVLYKY